MQLILSLTPREAQQLSRLPKSPALAAYRIGSGSHLLKDTVSAPFRGGWLSLSDQDAPRIDEPAQLADAIVRECIRCGFSGVILEFSRLLNRDRLCFVRTLQQSLAARQKTLLVPETAAVSGAVVLINTAVSGGSLAEHLQEEAARYPRIGLDLQRLRMDFPLPCRSGEGRRLSAEELEQLRRQYQPSVFFSRDLCARYFTYSAQGETHFVLFDDGETLTRKLRLGQQLGIPYALFLYPEVEDLIETLFPQKESR